MDRPVGGGARRELVRHRHKLTKTTASLKASVHAVLGKSWIVLPLEDIFGPVGLKTLAAPCWPSRTRPGWPRNAA